MSNFRAAALLMLSVLSACATSPPEIVRPVGGAVYPPTQYVEVLERAPSRPYKEIGTIDAPGEPGTLRTQMLAKISTKAQQLGADAVVLQDVSRPGPVVTRLNPTTGNYETTGGQMIPAFKGVAIKYQ